MQHFTKHIVLLYEDYRKQLSLNVTTMKLHKTFIWTTLSVLSLSAVVTLLSFTGGPQQKQAIANHYYDTVPKKNQDRDLDKELRALDKAQEQLQKLKEKDWQEVQRNIEESISKIDVERIQQQVDEAIKKIDFEKINRQVQESLRKIDFDKIERDIEQSLNDIKKIDKEEIKREIDKARKQVNEAMEKEEWKENMKEAQQKSNEEVKKALENTKKELARVKEEMKQQKFDMKKQFDEARQEVDKAKAEVKGYQDMIYGMEKDGLLNTKEDYTIEYKDGDLFVNGKKQPQDVADKYKKNFKKKTIAIKKQDGEVKIDHQ
ncbi:MAG TPA: hypothetical protein VIM79_00625 [Niastella sp.]